MDTTELQETEAPEASRPAAPPIASRFLFVDVAAMRAKQLRRGALPRLRPEDSDVPRQDPHKPERVAMEEVRRGLVQYDMPDLVRPHGGRHYEV